MIHMVPDAGPVKLTSTDLRGLAEALDGLAKVTARIDSFHHNGHTVHVEVHDDQRDGRWYVVTRITGPAHRSDGPVPRGGEVPR
jgi:hypothetical protein